MQLIITVVAKLRLIAFARQRYGIFFIVATCSNFFFYLSLHLGLLQFFCPELYGVAEIVAKTESTKNCYNEFREIVAKTEHTKIATMGLG